MNKPRMLDCYCGGGGATKGYQRAGFYVVGVDIKSQPHYIGEEFYRADALEYIREHGHEFDVIHASPPCQRFCDGTPMNRRMGHPDLISATREALLATGKPYIIENVRHAPLRADIVICGCQVGLPRIRRIRHFETNQQLFVLLPPCQHEQFAITVTGHGTTSGNRKTLGRNVGVDEMRSEMGIDWMNRDELSQAIPPAYTQLIGSLLMEKLGYHNE